MSEEEITGICPHCGKGVKYSWVEFDLGETTTTSHFEDKFKNDAGEWCVGECPMCKNCVLFHFIKIYGTTSMKTYPFPLPGPVDKRIPKDIKKDLEESKLCFSVGALNASAVMSRRSIQRACKKKNAEKKELLDQIDEISNKGIITRDLRDLAHTVRIVGNDGAHPNELNVNNQEAKEILELAEQFMEVLFVAPARVKEIQEKRVVKDVSKNG